MVHRTTKASGLDELLPNLGGRALWIKTKFSSSGLQDHWIILVPYVFVMYKDGKGSQDQDECGRTYIIKDLDEKQWEKGKKRPTNIPLCRLATWSMTSRFLRREWWHMWLKDVFGVVGVNKVQMEIWMKEWPSGWRASRFWTHGKCQNKRQLSIMRSEGCHRSTFVVFSVFFVICYL